MVRITRCPICSKIHKIKHNHYNNFVCCSTKFPITDYQLNVITQNKPKEPKITENNLEFEKSDENDINDIKEEELEIEEYQEPVKEEEFDYICGVCKHKFNEMGNRSFWGKLICPNCEATLNG